jgi:SAM-dependent methyltransferase
VSLPANPADELIDERYLAGSNAAVADVRGRAALILRRMGLWERVREPLPLAELAAVLGVLPELQFALAWLLAEAAALGAVRIQTETGRGDAYLPAAFPSEEVFAAQRRRLEEHADVAGSSLPLFDAVAAGYPDYLRGTRSGASLVLKPPALQLWESYFGPANPLYDVHNQLGWIGVREALGRLGRPGRLLELGAGTGGGTEAVLRGLRREGIEVAGFTLSDASPTFLVYTLQRLARELDPLPAALARRRLDFTRPLTGQGIAPGSVDVVVGTNALHNGSDPVEVLRAVRPALASDGFLVVSESLCEPAEHVHQDFIFNLLPLERSSVSSRFLSREAWEEILCAGGFEAEVFSNSRGPQLALLAIARPRA